MAFTLKKKLLDNLARQFKTHLAKPHDNGDWWRQWNVLCATERRLLVQFIDDGRN